MPGCNFGPIPKRANCAAAHRAARSACILCRFPVTACRARGRLAATEECAELTQDAIGGLVAPVVIDWAPQRRKADVEWRRLTVASDGQPVPSSDAFGFRLRIGELHLIVYRGLRNNDQPRTVLGMHTRNETVIGRFTKSGIIDPLLLVE